MTSKIFKAILGILTIGSLLTALFASFILPEYINAENHEVLLFWREWIKDISMIILFILFIFYMFYSLLSKAIPKDKKYLWAALLFFGSFIVMPFFWYHHVWKSGNAT